MLTTAFTAYALSRDRFPGKKTITALVVFTMYFSGGLIPLYLLVRDLGLMNSLASVILVYGANTFYLLLMRSYFLEIPTALEESAKIDGANDLVILLRIMLPLALPIVATVTLFFSVDRWNEWFNAMLFLRRKVAAAAGAQKHRHVHDRRYRKPQRFHSQDGVRGRCEDGGRVYYNGTHHVYVPFLAKYFMKGILIGSVKS